MDIQAYFNDIRTVIAVDLDQARQSIDAAVAWLTDPVLFEALLRAARRGCRVRLALLDDAINRQSGLNLERLRAAGGEVFWIPGAQGGQGSLHHKFCVTDGDGVMTGSYNWTRRASRADENMIRVRGDAALAAGYTEAFTQLLEQLQRQDWAAAQPFLDKSAIIRRRSMPYGYKMSLRLPKPAPTRRYHVSTSKPTTVRCSRLNSMPIKCIGWPRARYLSA